MAEHSSRILPVHRLRRRRLRAAIGLTATLAATAALTPLGAAPAQADGPGAGNPWVVSVGDSYISGEAGRWAGSSNDSSARADALGASREDRARFERAGKIVEQRATVLSRQMKGM